MHRDPCSGGVGRVNRPAKRAEVVCRGCRLRQRAVLTPFREIADDLHPRRPGRHFGLDRRGELVRRDGGMHAGEVPVRRGKEPAGGSHDRMPGHRSAREAEADLAKASGIADYGNPCGRVFLQTRSTVLAVRQVWAVLVSCDSRVGVRVDEPGDRIPAGQLLRLARSCNHTVARKAVSECP